MKVLAGIVLFHPDKTRLRENIDAVRSQVDAIAVWDNGCDSNIELGEDVVRLSQNQKNIGVASALNGLCEYAVRYGFDWILTLDQDSIVPAGLVKEYSKYINYSAIGMLCPCVLDRNYGSMGYDKGSDNETDDIDSCITSASLLRLSAWQKVGGFWDELFIDMVDFDMCWTLRERGYSITRVNNLSLYHEIGKGRKVRLLGKENVVYNHPPIRCYYYARNTLVVGKKHHLTSKMNRWLFKRIILINLYERQRIKKDKMIIKGIIHGIRWKRSL